MSKILLTSTKANVSINLRGTGSVSFKWGDGKSDTYELPEGREYICSHNYEDYEAETSHVITITEADITSVSCVDDGITALDVSGAPELETLKCSKNLLSGIDISGLEKLKYLSCSVNKLSGLDVSENTALETLRCRDNKLPYLDVSALSELKILSCSLNKLENLSVPGLSNLVYLNCKSNKMTGDALNSLFASLPFVVPDAKAELRIGDNPGVTGASSCNTETAKNKGWLVDYSSSSKPPVNTFPEYTEEDRQWANAINAKLWAIPAHTPADMVNSEMFEEAEQNAQNLEMPDGLLKLTYVERKFNEQPMYILGSGYENIYPGAMVYINQNITKGSPDPVGYLKRAPVTIYGDFLAGKTTRQENVPATSGNIKEASNNIMRTLLADKTYEAPGMQAPRTRIYTSMKHLMLDFKISSEFAGMEIKVNCKTDSTDTTFLHTTTLEQDYFMVRLDDAWKDDPSMLFDKSVTCEDIENFIENRAIAIVTSVTYGRKFSFLKEYSSKEYSYVGSQVVKGYGQSVDSSQESTEKTTALNEDVFNVGGASLTEGLLTSDKDQKEIDRIMADNMKFSEKNQGVVVKYTIALVSGKTPNTALASKYNGRYYEQTYKKYPKFYTIKVKKNYTSIAGATYSTILDCAFMDKDGNRVVANPKAVIRDGELEQDHFKKNIVGYDGGFTSNMHAPAGAYFKNVQLRMRNNSMSSGSMTEKEKGFIDDASFQSGEIDIVAAGSQVVGQGGVYLHRNSKTKANGKPN